MANGAENSTTIGAIVGVFIMLIIGISFLNTTSDQVEGTQILGNVVNETIVITAGTGQLVNIENGVFELGYFGNSTNSTDVATLTVDSHVNFTEAGVVTVTTEVFVNDNYNVSYEYFPQAYVQNRTGRTLLNLIPLFFVLAVFFIGVGASQGLFDKFKL